MLTVSLRADDKVTRFVEYEEEFSCVRMFTAEIGTGGWARAGKAKTEAGRGLEQSRRGWDDAGAHEVFIAHKV